MAFLAKENEVCITSCELSLSCLQFAFWGFQCWYSLCWRDWRVSGIKYSLHCFGRPVCDFARNCGSSRAGMGLLGVQANCGILLYSSPQPNTNTSLTLCCVFQIPPQNAGTKFKKPMFAGIKVCCDWCSKLLQDVLAKILMVQVRELESEGTQSKLCVFDIVSFFSSFRRTKTSNFFVFLSRCSPGKFTQNPSSFHSALTWNSKVLAFSLESHTSFLVTDWLYACVQVWRSSLFHIRIKTCYDATRPAAGQSYCHSIALGPCSL
jgi:hypothetical protein